MSWQLAWLPAGQGGALGFDVLAADPARAPPTASPLRLMAKNTWKLSERNYQTQGMILGWSGSTLLFTSYPALDTFLDFSKLGVPV